MRFVVLGIIFFLPRFKFFCVKALIKPFVDIPFNKKKFRFKLTKLLRGNHRDNFLRKKKDFFLSINSLFPKLTHFPYQQKNFFYFYW